jgi:hypothetical protein
LSIKGKSSCARAVSCQYKNAFLLNGTDGIIGITLSSADLQTTRFFARNWGFCLNAVGVFSCLPFPFVIQW